MQNQITTDSKEFIIEVIKEIEGLKLHAPHYNLDYAKFNYTWHTIYRVLIGPYTIQQNVNRVKELIKQVGVTYEFEYTFSLTSEIREEKPYKNAFTPLECYMHQYPTFNEDIINYIKGRTDFDLNTLYKNTPITNPYHILLAEHDLKPLTKPQNNQPVYFIDMFDKVHEGVIDGLFENNTVCWVKFKSGGLDRNNFAVCELHIKK